MVIQFRLAAFVGVATGNVVFACAHPLFWAPVGLIGDGGGGKPAII